MKNGKRVWLLLAALLVVCAPAAKAQGGAIQGITFGPTGTPKGGVAVTVCLSTATVTNGVCSPAESDANCCFTDATLTVRLTAPAAPNQLATVVSDGLGNYLAWAAPGTYKVSFSGTGVVATTQTVVVACVQGATGCGGAPVVATVALTAQTASIGTTTLYTVPTSGAGMYRVSVDIICTTSGAAGTVGQTTGWNNGTTAASLTTASPLSLAATGELPAISGNFYAAAGQLITYSTTVTGGAGAQYAIRIKLEYLGP
ncbi:MAG: hypothetical protein NVS9B14_06740 [Candidatus Acidiferrum sp.]